MIVVWFLIVIMLFKLLLLMVIVSGIPLYYATCIMSNDYHYVQHHNTNVQGKIAFCSWVIVHCNM